MAAVSPVKPEYGPTLPELLAPRPRWVRVAVAAALALVAAAGLYLAVKPSDETAVLVRGPVTFNLVHGPEFVRAREPGALLALRRSRGGLFLDSYVIRPLTLPPYRGAVGGTLPVYAFGYLRELGRRYDGFRFVSEGRTRINNGIGYQVVFRAKQGTRTLYGRHLLLVPEEPEGLRRGVVLELLSTPAAGTPNAEGTGAQGPLKTPLRSFRFGADREGGTA
jgi:hypothetical protein